MTGVSMSCWGCMNLDITMVAKLKDVEVSMALRCGSFLKYRYHYE